MGRTEHVALMATYNQWMNDKLYAASRQLPADVLRQDCGAFFGSIQGTLNHIAVGDTLWLKRFAAHPAGFQSLHPVQAMPTPTALDAPLFATFDDLEQRRHLLDSTILDFSRELKDEHLDAPFGYTSTKGVKACKNFFGVLMHFFNHQTHHRGQATTLLSQQGIDVGATDLLLLIPE